MRALSLFDQIMSSHFRFPLLPYLCACLLALTALSAYWYERGRAVELPDVVSATHKLQCASYTPFAKDQSPYDQPLVVRPERVDADLALLAKSFQCVRTYSMTGLESLPAVARKYGLKLMIGAWVNSNPQDTSKEVEALIASANANPDVVSAVIVGNEALLRKEVTGKRLASLIGYVKSKIKQPVTYADVWDFWLQHPEVAPAVDFLTIHLLPYWEDDPAGIDDALARVADVRETFGKRFAPKDILIGETGWPSEGRQRETALPSRVNEAKFIRGFVALADQKGWHYNLIEAFDQPWKRRNEGVVGGYWGLLDADRGDKGILAGPVSNLPEWSLWLGASAFLGIALLAVAGRPRSRQAAWSLPALAGLGAGCLVAWWQLATVSARYPSEWLWIGALTLLVLGVLAHVTLALSSSFGWRQQLFAWVEKRALWWLLGSGFAGAVMMLEMVFDPRYRSFPTAILLVPGLAYVLRPVAGPRHELMLLALLIGLGIVPQIYREGLVNVQAWLYALVNVLLVTALWRCARATAIKIT